MSQDHFRHKKNPILLACSLQDCGTRRQLNICAQDCVSTAWDLTGTSLLVPSAWSSYCRSPVVLKEHRETGMVFDFHTYVNIYTSSKHIEFNVQGTSKPSKWTIWGEKFWIPKKVSFRADQYHLYTTYSPCLLGGYMLPIPPFTGTWKIHWQYPGLEKICQYPTALAIGSCGRETWFWVDFGWKLGKRGGRVDHQKCYPFFGERYWKIKNMQQMYGHFEEFGLQQNSCSVWVGRIYTPQNTRFAHTGFRL